MPVCDVCKKENQGDQYETDLGYACQVCIAQWAYVGHIQPHGKALKAWREVCIVRASEIYS